MSALSGHEYQSIAEFRSHLVRYGLLFPTPNGDIYGYGKEFAEVADAVHRLIGRMWEADEVEVLSFPPIIPRSVFENSRYFDSFPQLAGTVHCFCGNDEAHRRMLASMAVGDDWTGAQKPTGVVLTPAACYPVYPLIASRGPLPEGGWIVDASSYCFRHEPSPDPLRLQMFRQREQVCFGNADRVLEFRETWISRALAMFSTLSLPASEAPAHDAFFGRFSSLKADVQRSQNLKVEIHLQMVEPGRLTACGSCNYHKNHFATAFGLHLVNGDYAHTACAGFGIERLTLALFHYHGFVPNRWPQTVRDALWPSE